MKNRTEEKKQTETETKNSGKEAAVENVRSLVQWRFTEEKKKSSKDKELLVIVICIAVAILSVLATNYIFSVLLILAAVTLVNIMRKPPKNLLFSVTDIGLFMDDDFIELDCIKEFNIIDDPGERARLILKVEKIVHINEIIPIYDVNIADIEHALRHLEIPKKEELQPTAIDKITAVII